MKQLESLGPKFSRRALLESMRLAPLVFLPAALRAAPLWASPLSSALASGNSQFPLSDFHVTPHYPTKSPVDDVLRLVTPGSDEYVTEKYAFEIMRLLNDWSRELREAAPALDVMARFLDPAIAAPSLNSAAEKKLRGDNGLTVVRRQFPKGLVAGRDRFVEAMRGYLSAWARLETAEFQIVGIRELPGLSLKVAADIRYELVGTRMDGIREQRIGLWLTEWNKEQVSDSSGWRALRWEATDESVCSARGPMFVDVTAQALGNTESYRQQLRRGVDSWRTTLDAACGIDVYGNNGVAAGDFDGDGWDDLYVCQPAGLPNRLYRNRGDGTFEDVTKAAGVDVLDGTACALFADFENKGLQDLLVVCGSGPLLFLNEGNGKFRRKNDAFRFVTPPQGTFTHAALADYDGDGRLDIYFCLYSYYLGLDQYHYPTPYFDARNGPPNFLMHNEGNATFQDRTEATGLNAENNRYSFACAWGDANGDGAPDLYVVNDFGRSNLYRNGGDGTFQAVSAEAGVDSAGAGMSACWFDFDGDGKQDLYAANMWSAAGLRVSEQTRFQEKDPENIRGLYLQHARGNALHRNLGDGKFARAEAGVEMGRWAWCSDSWDFDHDGYADLYIANGYITGPESAGGNDDKDDLSSFFWRQLVAKSPPDALPSTKYELGWNAINELIRSDGSWSGRERNVFYANNGDGTFSDVSGVMGLDLLDDSRSFALADLDHDGRLEMVLKNRTGPQVRILRNGMTELGNRVALRLRGVKSNRDAIGAAVTVEAGGHRQTKYLQAGSGFLSQHGKELFFGVGAAEGVVRASVRWPSGLTQNFEQLPVNRRIEIVEGAAEFRAAEFAASLLSTGHDAVPPEVPAGVETWLMEPLSAPEFSLPDLAGTVRKLRTYRGSAVLLCFWTASSSLCGEQLASLQRSGAELSAGGLRVLGICANEGSGAVRAVTSGLTFPNLLATPEVLGVYNIVYRYLFDRRRDLGLPSSFLLDSEGRIVKVYQGKVEPTRLEADARAIAATDEERVRRALPFAGTLHQGSFRRNAFTYGVAFFQRGYLEQAEASFRQVIAAKPEDAEAYYNLGTLCLRRNALPEARVNLERALKQRPEYPEAWNNLGMMAAQDGHVEEAIGHFQQSLRQRPNYATALLNLGNVYRRQGANGEAETALKRAAELEPENPEANYSLGMFYARQEKLELALPRLEKAVELRPDYTDALNNLGVLLVREKEYALAEEKFQTCIRLTPNQDQAYLNLARLYVLLDEKEKAREALRALLRVQPGHKVAQETLELLN